MSLVFEEDISDENLEPKSVEEGIYKKLLYRYLKLNSEN